MVVSPCSSKSPGELNHAMAADPLFRTTYAFNGTSVWCTITFTVFVAPAAATHPS